MTNVGIEKVMKRHKVTNFRGVYSKDMLPKRMRADECCIINLEDYFDGEGTHWVCVYNDPSSNDVEYFDSFGLTPPDCVKNYMTIGDKGIVYNSSDIQNLDSQMCGYYCCYYIIERYAGRQPIDVLCDFDQEPTMSNEQLIRKVARSI